MDIIKRLNNDEMAVDAIDDAIAEITALRAAHEALLRRTQSLETALDQERADNERLRAFAQDCEDILGRDEEIAALLNVHELTDMMGNPTALLSGRGEGGG